MMESEFGQERFKQGSLKGFNTFNPTFTITTEIFELIESGSKTMVVMGSKEIGKSYTEYLAYHLYSYTSQKIFYLPTILDIQTTCLLAKQLFLSTGDRMTKE